MITVKVVSPTGKTLGYLLLGCETQIKGWSLVERKADHSYVTLPDNCPSRVKGLRRLN